MSCHRHLGLPGQPTQKCLRQPAIPSGAECRRFVPAATPTGIIMALVGWGRGRAGLIFLGWLLAGRGRVDKGLGQAHPCRMACV